MLDLLIDTKVVARTPRHLGVNVEVQEHHDRTNLWDWLAHAGATALREFHPERNLRKRAVALDAWSDIRSRGNYDDYRGRVASSPDDEIPWDAYAFAEEVPWLGVPDAIIARAMELGAEPIVSMGWAPMDFPRPLVTDLDRATPADDDVIDWAAACAAYEYYFAVIYRYAAGQGARYFILHNEPEFLPQRFWLGERIRAKAPSDRTSGDWAAVLDAVCVQLGAMARVARDAMEDVRGLIEDRELAGSLLLSGPAANWQWARFWPFVEPYVDVCDFHIYTREAESLQKEYDRLAMRAGQSNKRTAMTEFNRRGGPIQIDDLLHCADPALEAASLLMTSLEMSRPEEALCEFATFYHFRFPSTHRNYKSLAYGDMNCVDWSGLDEPLNGRGDEWHPTFEELQVRFPTMAYFCFRMLARLVPRGGGEEASYPVLRVCPSAYRKGPKPPLFRFQAIARDQELILNILNRTADTVHNLQINLEKFAGHFAAAVVRRTSVRDRDAVVAEYALAADADHAELEATGQSLTQVILTPVPLHRIEALRLVEETHTPGGIEKGLALLETTRLRAIGTLDGREHDLTDLNVTWRSSRPQAVMAHQGGLVQRLRASAADTIVEAVMPNGVTASRTIPAHRRGR